jgi:hypothetical protein
MFKDVLEFPSPTGPLPEAVSSYDLFRSFCIRIRAFELLSPFKLGDQENLEVDEYLLSVLGNSTRTVPVTGFEINTIVILRADKFRGVHDLPQLLGFVLTLIYSIFRLYKCCVLMKQVRSYGIGQYFWYTDIRNQTM